METFKSTDSTRTEIAHIGKSVIVRGELSGSEDLYLDGEVEGSIELRDHHLTIGPHSKVRAQVNARDIVVHGQLNGNVHGTERVELKKTAVLTGDIITLRIVIEDGAVFKGSIETQREAAKSEPKPETAEVVAAAGAAASLAGISAGSHASITRTGDTAAPKAVLVEQKK
jgi:cytoskeletal protein CcmA (bactofilin family)